MLKAKSFGRVGSVLLPVTIALSAILVFISIAAEGVSQRRKFLSNLHARAVLILSANSIKTPFARASDISTCRLSVLGGTCDGVRSNCVSYASGASSASVDSVQIDSNTVFKAEPPPSPYPLTLSVLPASGAASLPGASSSNTAVRFEVKKVLPTGSALTEIFNGKISTGASSSGQIPITNCLATSGGSSGGGSGGSTGWGSITCFPETTWLKVKSSSGKVEFRPIRDIRIGDLVLATRDNQGREVYSPIVEFLHREPETRSQYLTVKAGASQFKISPEHLVYYASTSDEIFSVGTTKTKFAKDLVPGDLLFVQGASLARVDGWPSKSLETGIYAPESETGTLVVFGSPEEGKGTVVSSYALFAYPGVARAFCQTRRFFFPPSAIDDATVVTPSRFIQGLVQLIRWVVPQAIATQ